MARPLLPDVAFNQESMNWAATGICMLLLQMDCYLVQCDHILPWRCDASTGLERKSLKCRTMQMGHIMASSLSSQGSGDISPLAAGLPWTTAAASSDVLGLPLPLLRILP